MDSSTQSFQSIAEQPSADPVGDVTTDIVLEIARRTGRDVEELPPLYDVLDPDALGRLVRSAEGAAFSVRFEYANHEVVVGEDGIELDAIDD